MRIRKALVALSTLVGLALATPPAVAGAAVDYAGASRADDPNVFIWTNAPRGGNCMGAGRSKGADVTLPNIGPPCEDAPGQTWEFHHVRTHSNGTRLYQIRYPLAAPDLCLSIEGVESGQSSYGDDAQLEACEGKDDAVWWREHLGGNAYHIRRYIPGHPDRCLAPDMSDSRTPNRSVQLEGCGSSNEILWRIGD